MTWANNAEISARFRAVTVTCECPQIATGPWDCLDCPIHGKAAHLECEQTQQSEIDAENAWLRYAEMPTADDYAFEAWEAERGLI